MGRGGNAVQKTGHFGQSGGSSKQPSATSEVEGSPFAVSASHLVEPSFFSRRYRKWFVSLSVFFFRLVGPQLKAGVDPLCPFFSLYSVIGTARIL